MKDSKYIGNELTIFKVTVDWKQFWYNSISIFISGDVIEVASGIGVNTNIILKKSFGAFDKPFVSF